MGSNYPQGFGTIQTGESLLSALCGAQAVHTKRVDSNLLAEFVPCPMLLLP